MNDCTPLHRLRYDTIVYDSRQMVSGSAAIWHHYVQFHALSCVEQDFSSDLPYHNRVAFLRYSCYTTSGAAYLPSGVAPSRAETNLRTNSSNEKKLDKKLRFTIRTAPHRSTTLHSVKQTLPRPSADPRTAQLRQGCVRECSACCAEVW